jgi:hypothetical protein
MSSAENKSPRSPKTTSSSKAQTAAQASPSPYLPSSAETSSEIMDQHLDSTLIATPPAPPKTPEVMSSTVPDPSEIKTDTKAEPPAVPSDKIDGVKADAPDQNAKPVEVIRQQPIPPASEPMQYRAIGLVRGKYVPSEEQFTRGNLHTDDGVAIDAVLLGRVMSLVKKHLDLEQSHLWVVYPRTREKEYDLHVQIVGVWEPENLNQLPTESDESDESDVADEDEDEELTDSHLLDDEAAEIPPEKAPSEAEATEPETPSEATSPIMLKAPSRPVVAAETKEAPSPEDSELDDRYFSVRGEVVFYAPETQQVLVKIRRLPRQGDKQSKAFKVALQGTLEGKSVGYFWDFNVQRQGNLLVVQNGTLIKMVPPQKGEAKPKFARRGPGGPGGRKRWNREDGPPREGSAPRPSRPQGDRPARPAPRDGQTAERKAPLSKPILKRRNPDSSS